MVVSVQGSARRYLLIAGGLLLRTAANIRICRKNSWHHTVTGIHPCEHSLPSQKVAWSTTNGITGAKTPLAALPKQTYIGGSMTLQVGGRRAEPPAHARVWVHFFMSARSFFKDERQSI